LKKAVKLIGGKIPTEASGGINLDNITQYAKTGVTYISVGALTHSAKAVDISLELED
jgi:nicotinate-nucleotide pyrophosphorylase (carboxylating)